METKITLNKEPSIIPLYMGCLLKKINSIVKEEIINKLSLNYNRTIDKDKLYKFNNFFQIKNSNDIVPPTFMYLLIFKAQLKFLLHESLPFPVIGLIHVSNDIINHKDIFINDEITINISVKDFKDNNLGKRVTIHTEIYSNNDLCWESFSGYFYPNKTNKNKRRKKLKLDSYSDLYDLQKKWDLESNLGRKFAKLSSDINPIHIHKYFAKLFGFKETIIHGMYMAIKIESELKNLTNTNNKLKRLYVDFKSPIFLPSKVNFNIINEENNKKSFKILSIENKELIKGYAVY